MTTAQVLNKVTKLIDDIGKAFSDPIVLKVAIAANVVMFTILLAIHAPVILMLIFLLLAVCYDPK